MSPYTTGVNRPGPAVSESVLVNSSSCWDDSRVGSERGKEAALAQKILDIVPTRCYSSLQPTTLGSCLGSPGTLEPKKWLAYWDPLEPIFPMREGSEAVFKPPQSGDGLEFVLKMRAPTLFPLRSLFEIQ
ncbi:predicted protein [Aspergillus nidulans FGSC A4]|uniref:Uncharacterized protein n=1 Tax=Emericella nidulans (strain FGSC A4 / ATCC 38163 / CBS 112.46 / NRRL 194 / M139) TaxID=227321 RepID=Q5AU52_EMENI|nr:hypothetical protein [Aspergillus nidulans FGSC A4]EAA59200.1 predicted protein [Aspergillus nidulans FGSC A4]CBF74046.1 TPA: conserved hypothetical protein [Aspergillus nidulans FGSC A4]|eukprot:XP_681447.1 predicted protein [Aspergillus nidulans FGSC A4]